MRRLGWTLALLLGATRVEAAQIWATWELDLGTHAPPTAFVLSVASPSGAPVPADMVVPWQQCGLPRQPAGTYCAPIGCPAAGVYEFQVRAQYAEGLSDPSKTFRCTLIPPGGCNCVDALLAGLPVPPPAPTPPRPAPLQPEDLGTPPPLPQRSAEGLGLLPIGPLPAIPQVPTIPRSATT